MRPIIFRGKRVDNGEWVYGDLFSITTEQGNKGFFIIVENTSETDESIPNNSICFEHGKDCFYVDPETVGQFTGFYDDSDLIYDKNKKPIYEGDIVQIFDEDLVVVGSGSVEFLEEHGLWYVDGEGEANNGLGDIRVSFYLSVIGNIHDQEEETK